MKTVIALTLLLAASTGFAEEAKPSKDSKPNIIIIMPDDSGYGNHPCFGNPVIKTPNIDALLKQSLLLTRYHSSARCSPSRAKLMSGRHEFLGGVTDTRRMRERLSLDTITLPQALKTAGYATGFFGKWHLGNEGPYRPENRGFDECWIYAKGARMAATISHNGKSQRMTGTYPTDLFFKKATEWIDVQRQAKTPFFVYLPPKSPHGPFKEDSSDMPNEDYKKFLGTHPKMTVKNAKIYWEVENIDKRIGEMIKQLEEWGIADETLFIFIGSDNGASGGSEIHNAGMKGHKGQPYQGGTRVPAFFRWPGGGIKGGSESATLTSQMDIMPTLLEITGVPLPDAGLLKSIGITSTPHTLSHFGANTALHELNLQRTRKWMQLYSEFIDLLRSSRDPLDPNGGAIFDNSLVFFGGGLRTGHRNTNIPCLLTGAGFNGLRHGQHRAAPNENTPLANLWTTMLQDSGDPIDRFADADGTTSSVWS